MADVNLNLPDISLFGNKEEKPKGKEKRIRHERSKNASMYERLTRNVYRRAFSETRLLDLFKLEEFKKGYSYHCISGGDVDSLSYLKIVLRRQELEYCLASTWCMALDDILQVEEWLKGGKIKKLDFYVGEIFKGSYSVEYRKLKEVIEGGKYGKVVLFRNHSKVYAGYGDKFHFAIESSANINTNPRTENTCITIDKGLFNFYYNYYNEIISFDRDNK